MQALDSARMVVAIDGPSGSGKSTVARGVARNLGFGYLDTGAMYRAVTWLVLHEGIAGDGLPGQAEKLTTLLAASALVVGTDPGDRVVTINGHDVTEAIRGAEVTGAVSAVAASPAVRAHLAQLQRSLSLRRVADAGGMVVEGRDIGTVIFPDARLKVWLTASPEARGRRRAAELSDGAAPGAAAVEGTVEQLARRDSLDASRAISPLQCAPDAHVLDTTSMPADEVIAAVLSLWHTVVLPDASGPHPATRSGHDDHLQDSPSGATR